MSWVGRVLVEADRGTVFVILMRRAREYPQAADYGAQFAKRNIKCKADCDHSRDFCILSRRLTDDAESRSSNKNWPQE